MTHWVEIIKTVLPVVLMLIIGILCRKYNVFTREGINALKKLAINITLLAMVIHAFMTTEYTLRNVLVSVVMFCMALLAWFLGALFGKALKQKSRFFPFLITGFEGGMLGYAFTIMLYGADKASDFAYLDLGQALFVFTIYKVLLSISGGEKPSAKKIFSEMARSSIMIGIGCGILLGATGIYKMLEPSGISGIIDACTEFVSAPTSAIILLTIGYDLVFDDIPWASTLKTVLSRVVIMLALRFLMGYILRLIGLGDSFDQALNVIFIVPPPYVLPVFADDPDQRTYVSSVLSVSTVASLIAFAVLAIIG